MSKRNIFNLIKTSIKKLASIIFNGERVTIFLLKSETRKRHIFFPFLFSVVPDSLAGTIRHVEEIKTSQLENKKENMIFYVGNTSKSTKTYLNLYVNLAKSQI